MPILDYALLVGVAELLAGLVLWIAVAMAVAALAGRIIRAMARRG